MQEWKSFIITRMQQIMEQIVQWETIPRQVGTSGQVTGLSWTSEQVAGTSSLEAELDGSSV